MKPVEQVREPEQFRGVMAETGAAALRLAMRHPKTATLLTGYVIYPLDFAPDPLLPIGVFDDLAIVATGSFAIYKEYKNYKNNRQSSIA